MEPRRTLADCLREDLGLTGTNVGCEQGVCGACTVLVDGESVALVPDARRAGRRRRVVTVEGMATAMALHPVQQAFLDTQAQQCGFCTPGFLTTTVELLDRDAKPTEAEIRDRAGGQHSAAARATSTSSTPSGARGEVGRDAT